MEQDGEAPAGIRGHPSGAIDKRGKGLSVAPSGSEGQVAELALTESSRLEDLAKKLKNVSRKRIGTRKSTLPMKYRS